ncbi:GWxTD domain-containing protein [Pontibacter sp. KCTC 32443]|nr:GWxTD domain-containing protein [Pontibacter sp. KCTC 32443]
MSIPREIVIADNSVNLKLWQKFAGEARMHSAFNIALDPGMLEKMGLLVQAKSKIPLIRTYTTTADSMLLENADTTAAMLVYYFKSEFTPALPPMSERKEAAARTLQPSDSLTIDPNNTFALPQDGLYLLWPDKSFSTGLLVEQWSFPRITMAKEMLQPLIYLTTSTERERLFKATDPKKAVDEFWIQVAGEKHLARELIRTYYGRVEHANKLYTSHKPGWATDRGMIYLVYGPPSDISRVADTETWIYRESEMHPYIKFVFTKKQNNFTGNHYELIRHREYEESWYSAVAKWRAGITDM